MPLHLEAKIWNFIIMNLIQPNCINFWSLKKNQNLVHIRELLEAQQGKVSEVLLFGWSLKKIPSVNAFPALEMLGDLKRAKGKRPPQSIQVEWSLLPSYQNQYDPFHFQSEETDSSLFEKYTGTTARTCRNFGIWMCGVGATLWREKRLMLKRDHRLNDGTILQEDWYAIRQLRAWSGVFIKLGKQRLHG